MTSGKSILECSFRIRGPMVNAARSRPLLQERSDSAEGGGILGNHDRAVHRSSSLKKRTRGRLSAQ